MEFIDFGGSGPPLHLAHANGFPPGAYRRLAEALATRFHVIALVTRPLVPGSDPAAMRDWGDLAADLRRELLARGDGPFVGVGHSVGAVTTMMAAAADPGLFRSIVLIDPVLFAGVRQHLWGWCSRAGLLRFVPIVRAAARRRDMFARFDPR